MELIFEISLLYNILGRTGTKRDYSREKKPPHSIDPFSHLFAGLCITSQSSRNNAYLLLLLLRLLLILSLHRSWFFCFPEPFSIYVFKWIPVLLCRRSGANLNQPPPSTEYSSAAPQHTFLNHLSFVVIVGNQRLRNQNLSLQSENARDSLTSHLFTMPTFHDQTTAGDFTE